ncbi:MAG: tRNA (adenosine(37)-N6)-dimethylallyltransferase MiaA [Armatimonadetes bacterium]|nr:tRNA (adenosine(37)-N6)-dimethylallyltransferase MiaA [Armatimonadota bacterium]
MLIIVILGPTASGKTEVSIALARCFGHVDSSLISPPLMGGARGGPVDSSLISPPLMGGAMGGSQVEIISADSRQVYRYLNVGTAKPTLAERKGIPHHLVDFMDPDRELTLAEYQAEALRVLEDIRARGNQPFLVGGSGLYVRSVVQGYRIPPVPPDASYRAALQKIAQNQGGEALHRLLSKVDSDSASRLHPKDDRRIIRALEVHHATGCTLSHFLSQPRKRDFRVLKFGLTMERERLYRRISERVEKMLEAGLLEEAKSLMEKGYGEKLLSMEAHGYREMIRHLKGELPLSEAIRQMVRNTRHYAKRQWTWFKKEPEVRWFSWEEYEEKDSKGGALGKIVEDMLHIIIKEEHP